MNADPLTLLKQKFQLGRLFSRKVTNDQNHFCARATVVSIGPAFQPESNEDRKALYDDLIAGFNWAGFSAGK